MPGCLLMQNKIFNMIIFCIVFVFTLPWCLKSKRGDMNLELLKFESKYRFCFFSEIGTNVGLLSKCLINCWPQNHKSIVDSSGGRTVVK